MNQKNNRFIRTLSFPYILCSFMAGSFLLSRQFGPAPWILLILIPPAGILVHWLERIIPYEKSWRPEVRDLKLGLIHVLGSQLLPVTLVKFALLALWNFVPAGLSLAPWIEPLPFLVQFLLVAWIADFPAYWLHRWMHESSSLWKLHAVHHSVPNLYWLNAVRFHPLDTALSFGFQSLFLKFLGASDELLLVWSVFSAVHSLFQHCNADVRAGVLNYIFSMAEPHRWHHSKKLEEANHNYGAEWVIWDHVFGTFWLPRDRKPSSDIGFEGMKSVPSSWWRQVLWSFRG